MNRKTLVLVLMVTLFSWAWAQDAPAPPLKAPSGGPGMMGAMGEQHQKMMEKHKQHVAAMKADLDKMKAALEQMKTNVAKISDANEKARWQSNVDLWTLMVGHMEHMVKEMDSMGPGMMGPGMMHHGGMGAPPPAEKKPE